MAETYEQGWKDCRTRFSRGSNPLLKEFITSLNRLPDRNGNLKLVVEGGAGNGKQALAIAAHGYDVVAVEYSAHAAELIAQKAKSAEPHSGKIRVVNAELLNYLIVAHKEVPVDGFYANSVLHFFSRDERRKLLKATAELQEDGGAYGGFFQDKK